MKSPPSVRKGRRDEAHQLGDAECDLCKGTLEVRVLRDRHCMRIVCRHAALGLRMVIFGGGYHARGSLNTCLTTGGDIMTERISEDDISRSARLENPLAARPHNLNVF
ncbi:Hypothetical protein NTJ_01352 [Nesidiocoris tenuis]|uniref:Histone deacetylase domain-containing protein n=1 Tax=Nesidiocoris tenuis TaxID=355587 RepID=A0ABN7ACJ4_9HEMI|nr:Hypothetical protein NTJ_01352 [Nesidiocoris tenuis]